MKTLLFGTTSTHVAWGQRLSMSKRCMRSRHNERVSQFPPSVVVTEDEESQLCTLLARMQAGGADAQVALGQLYDASVARVFSLARRFVGNDAAAEDVTQEIYLQAWTQAARFDAQRGAVMAWLLNVARSRALDAWRKSKASVVTMDSTMAGDASAQLRSTAQPADLLEASDTRGQLHAEMALLPAATRQMLSLAFFHDMTHQDISQHLAMPLGTVKSTLRRALIALRERLVQQGISTDHLAALSLEEYL